MKAEMRTGTAPHLHRRVSWREKLEPQRISISKISNVSILVLLPHGEAP